jgi:lambda family phage portal protein
MGDNGKPSAVIQAPARRTVSLGRARSARVRVIGTYDAAQTTNRNENLWATVSGRSADAEASPAIRALIRNRCRFEARNNSYCRGMIDTKANDVVGRGPRLQMLTPDAAYDAAIEELFDEWAREINLGLKLRLAVAGRIDSGEGILLFVSNPALKHPVKLDVKLIECDRLRAADGKFTSVTYEDGVTYDELGNPVSYDVLTYHPGATSGQPAGVTSKPVTAADVIHLFKRTRPEQRRGVPEIAPALPLFGQLRRYTLATLSAAETAANIAMALVSKSADIEPVNVDPLDTIDLEMGSVTTMPPGWDITQPESKQPSTQYAEFKRELLNEIARCLGMPLNIALANSSGYNYASGRLDHQMYFKEIQTFQDDLGREAVTPIFVRWLEEYSRLRGAVVRRGEDTGGWVSPALQRVHGLSPALLGRRFTAEPHQWHWDGTEHVDPTKEATAQEMGLRNLTTTLAREYARLGLDWEDELRQIARERALLKELGIELPKQPAPSGAPRPQEPAAPPDDADPIEEE